MKRILFIWLAGLLLILHGSVFAQELIRGVVFDKESNEPLPGATIRVEGKQTLTISDEKGEFSLSLSPGQYRLMFSFIGFEEESIALSVPSDEFLVVNLLASDLQLQGIDVLATGYQELPKERVTGSFVGIDEELINRSVSSDIISRLNHVTSGLLVNPRAGNDDRISIRGKSTFFANSQPLIVVDNFPYDGPLENINPNDVEQITILRDAAAASIWGARAGNGVIVITTKNGTYEQPLRVSFNANVNLYEKPDAFYAQNMSPSDFLEVEHLLYSRNFYNSAINSQNKDAITPGVEIFHALHNGELTQDEADRQLALLRSQDLRNDINRYLYRPQLDQQYALQVSGGDRRQRFGVSLGYDQTRENVQANDRYRITFKGNQEFKLWKDRVTFSNQIALIRNQSIVRNQGVAGLNFSGLTETYPYARLADEEGNPLTVVRDFRMSFVQEAREQGLLNWEYSPLGNIGQTINTNTSSEFRWTSALIIQPVKGITAELSYQYWSNNQTTEGFNSQESYFTRNLINTYSQIRNDGSLVYPVPLGAILDRMSNEGESHQFRGLVRYAGSFGKHQINALGGFEAKYYQLNGYSARYYGYNPQLASSIPVDNINTYPYFYNPSISQVIPVGSGLSDLTDRFISYYGNAGYTYDNKVDLTISARKDQSNLFGVRANQRSVPLYSIGLGWTISEMSFFRRTQLPYLKIRSSYGYNGNIDKTLTGETTALFLTSSAFGFNPGLPYARILNPPYPDLRWERIRIVNFGLDFETKNSRISGSVEYYVKNGQDLIADTQLPPSSGLDSFRGNSANTKGKGWDIVLNSRNIVSSLTWDTQLLFSTNNETVSQYLLEEPISTVLSNGAAGFGRVYPVEGYPLYSMFSYPWAGLNPDNGNPQGILDGSPSEDFTSIIRESGIDDLVFHGSARPTVFGSIRNTLGWKGVSLSFNITYKLGYYYRRNSVLYNSLLRGNPGHADYALRWQNPGDELSTNVPSVPGNPNLNRDNLYRYSEALVEKGDHIRFQDISLSYRFQNSFVKTKVLDNLEIYSYINNLGILWKASSDPLDPEFRNLNPMRSFSLGLRGSF
ncbi:SusC/RagA family TonB-linked outer membrane protein [Algoriphagus vanfongensis]|uniref:SusC/RagA family TonB-linked outer membrane protein n=1 Tax=Algoriphagus vanfongensis TaxID=426371 RepID=UPI00040C1BD6|nr:SusC/RagA family TonB-linked outer membrane protein [Algoriphagus vanfongensis]